MVTGWSVKMRQNGGLDCYYTSAHLVCVKGIIYKGILLMSSLDHISGMGRNWRTGLINFSKDSWTWFVCICVLRALGSLGIKHLGGFLLSRTEYYSGTGLHKYFLFLNFFFPSLFMRNLLFWCQGWVKKEEMREIYFVFWAADRPHHQQWSIGMLFETFFQAGLWVMPELFLLELWWVIAHY